MAAQEGIVAEPNAFRNLINKYESIGSVCDATSEARAISHTKVTNQQLDELEKAVYKDRGLTARRLRTRFALQVANRTVQRYLNALGWRKIRTKYCQMVTLKNRVERIIYAII